MGLHQEVLVVRTFQRGFHVKCGDLYTIVEIGFGSRDLCMHREIVTCIGELLLRGSISYFVWRDLIDSLYIYMDVCTFIDFLRMGTCMCMRGRVEKGWMFVFIWLCIDGYGAFMGEVCLK